MIRHEVREALGHKPDALAALGYDTMKVLGDALSAPRRSTPVDRDAIAETKNVEGVTGSITLARPQPIGKKLVVEEIKDGQLTLLDTSTRARKLARDAGDRSAKQ